MALRIIIRDRIGQLLPRRFSEDGLHRARSFAATSVIS
jgi:hypothetical protein